MGSLAKVFFAEILRKRKVAEISRKFVEIFCNDPFPSDPISLGWHVCRANFGTKDVLGATNFLTKNASKFSPKFLSLCLEAPTTIPRGRVNREVQTVN